MVELKGAQQIPSVHFCSRLLARSFNPIPSWDSAEVWGIFTHQPSCRAAGLPASRPTGMPAYGSTHNKEQKKRTTVQRLLFHYKRIKERPFFLYLLQPCWPFSRWALSDSPTFLVDALIHYLLKYIHYDPLMMSQKEAPMAMGAF